jgi:hypothetical protein
MAAKKSAAKKTTARKTTAKKTTAKAAEAKAPEAAVQTTEGPQRGVVRVPAGGIDPRLVERRERLREAERDVRPAAPTTATIDPKLVEIREATKKREAELANRSIRKPPARA